MRRLYYSYRPKWDSRPLDIARGVPMTGVSPSDTVERHLLRLRSVSVVEVAHLGLYSLPHDSDALVHG